MTRGTSDALRTPLGLDLLTPYVFIVTISPADSHLSKILRKSNAFVLKPKKGRKHLVYFVPEDLIRFFLLVAIACSHNLSEKN